MDWLKNKKKEKKWKNLGDGNTLGSGGDARASSRTDGNAVPATATGAARKDRSAAELQAARARAAA